MLAAIDPEALVEADRIDHQRVALPPADRVAVVGRRQILGVLAAVHVDRAEGMRAADVEDVGHLLVRELDEFGSVRRQPLARPARRLAARVRLELVSPAIVRDTPRVHSM